MRNRLIVLIAIVFCTGWVNAQDAQPYKRNALTFNVTRFLINELSFSFERFTSQRKSIEFEFGLVRSSEFWQEAIDSYTDDPIFYEEGYTIRFHYKIWRTKDNSKWRNYLAPGIVYKYLHYEDLPLTIDKTNEKGYTETLLQDRARNKAGLDFLWGSVYEASRTFAFEFYYGAGLTLTSSERTDHDRYIIFENPNDQTKNQSMPTYIDNSLYLRPVVNAGLKIVVRL